MATGLDEKKLLAVRLEAAAQQAISDAVEVDEPDDIMAYSGEICVDEEEDWDPSLYRARLPAHFLHTRSLGTTKEEAAPGALTSRMCAASRPIMLLPQ